MRFLCYGLLRFWWLAKNPLLPIVARPSWRACCLTRRLALGERFLAELSFLEAFVNSDAGGILRVRLARA